jgi:hypothetical protein
MRYRVILYVATMRYDRSEETENVLVPTSFYGSTPKNSGRPVRAEQGVLA